MAGAALVNGSRFWHFDGTLEKAMAFTCDAVRHVRVPASAGVVGV